MSLRKFDLNDIQVAKIRYSLEAKRDSIKRLMSKHATGSAIHKALAAEMSEIQVLITLFF